VEGRGGISATGVLGLGGDDIGQVVRSPGIGVIGRGGRSMAAGIEPVPHGAGVVGVAGGCGRHGRQIQMVCGSALPTHGYFLRSRRRQLFSAASASLKIIASAVLFERHPLDRTVRWRTVAAEQYVGMPFEA
jgi:hypothetical protein